MNSEIRCLITNELLRPKQWYWYSWEMDAPVSEKGLTEIAIRRLDPDDELAKLLWEEWEWTNTIN